MSPGIKMSVVSYRSWLFWDFFFNFFWVYDKLRCSAGHVLTTSSQSVFVLPQGESGGKKSLPKPLWDKTWCSLKTVSGSSGQYSCLDGRSAPPQMLSFTVNGQFREKHDPLSASSCLNWFQLPIIQAWLSSESMSEALQQQQQQLGSHAGGVLCCQPMAWLCAGTLSLDPARNITFLFSTHRGISEDAQQELGQHGVGISKPWQRELSVGHHWQWELMKSEIQTHPSLFHISKPWRQQLL